MYVLSKQYFSLVLPFLSGKKYMLLTSDALGNDIENKKNVENLFYSTYKLGCI